MFFLWPRANLSIDFTSRRSNNFNTTIGNDDDDEDDDVAFELDAFEFDDDAFEFDAIDDSCCPAWNIFNLLKWQKAIIYNNVIECV